MVHQMTLASVLLLLVSLMSSVGVGRGLDVDTRVEELIKLQITAADSVIRLDDTSYRRFTGGADRPYDLMLFFDAEQLRDNPDLDLVALRREYGILATSFVKNNKGKEDAKRVFFADAEYKQAQQTFRQLGVNMLPHIKYFPAGPASKVEEVNRERVPFTADALAAYIAAKAKVDVGPIERPPPVSKEQVAMVVGAIVVAAPFVIRWLVTSRTIFHDSRWWCLMGLAVYFFSVSGGMFNIIRGMPFSMQDRQTPGKVQYFYKGSGMQLGAEGFTVGGLYTAVGLLIALACHVVPKVESRKTQRVLMLICIAGSAVAIRSVLALQQWKSGYWAHAYWPSSWR
eukprot:jgi/Mesen1/10087/ME000074S09424